MISLDLRRLYFHHDYDGVVAAAMIQANVTHKLELQSIQYQPSLNWVEKYIEAGTGIVDFLYHPDAALWIDHHPTTFSNPSVQEKFQPDQFHVYAPNAASCPQVIVKLPWFEYQERWAEYVTWANIIDSAAYESAAQANDLTNPHLQLSYVIAAISERKIFADLVEAITHLTISEVLDSNAIKMVTLRVKKEEVERRDLLAKLIQPIGLLTFLDQSEFSMPYRRYLAYDLYPQTRYGIGLYRSESAVIVSVGENPWNKSGNVDLGKLCREYGGGGRPTTAGIPTSSPQAAREMAQIIIKRLTFEIEK